MNENNVPQIDWEKIHDKECDSLKFSKLILDHYGCAGSIPRYKISENDVCAVYIQKGNKIIINEKELLVPTFEIIKKHVSYKDDISPIDVEKIIFSLQEEIENNNLNIILLFLTCLIEKFHSSNEVNAIKLARKVLENRGLKPKCLILQNYYVNPRSKFVSSLNIPYLRTPYLYNSLIMVGENDDEIGLGTSEIRQSNTFISGAKEIIGLTDRGYSIIHKEKACLVNW
jgi:hypothetical protein